MNWFYRIVLSFSVTLTGTAAFSQGPGASPNAAPVGLGKSRPLFTEPRPASSAINAPHGAGMNNFEPIRRPARPVVSGAFPPPTVVRGARAVLDDDPRNLYLPRDLSPLDELKPSSPILPGVPARKKSANPAPMPIQGGANFYRVDKNVVIDVLPELPEATIPPVVETEVDQSIVPVRFSNERIILVNEDGTPLFDAENGMPRWYGQAEWLLWWSKGFQQPPLVTTASPNDTERFRGALGNQSTQIIFGNDTSFSGPRSGGRFTVGRCLDACGHDAIEATFFFLGNKQDAFIATSDQFPVIARPFFNVNNNQQDRQLVTTPGTLPSDLFPTAGRGIGGSIAINSSSRIFGFEANLRRELAINHPQARFSGILGFRYLDLREQLNMLETLVFLQPINVTGIRPGDVAQVFDNFDTRNRFFGGQIGISAECERGPWTFESRLKVGLGANTQTVDIVGGQSIRSTDGRVQEFTGGLYALNSNSGRRSQVRFSVVPEIDFKVGYNITDNIRLYAGYDFLYWGNVLRPGDQIDQTLDSNRVPTGGAADPPANVVRPVVPFRSTNFWAQGVTAGLQIRY